MAKFGMLEHAVSLALQDVRVPERDKATAELARRYARLIDAAQPAAKYRAHLTAMDRALRMLAAVEPLAASEAAEHIDKIADALSAHSVASDLGPKLLAALVQLGMTPAARGAKGGDQVGTPVARPESEFERARRRARERASG